MPVKMTAEKGFTNSRLIKSPRGDGSVLPGESFETDWLHAKDLDRLGIAKADDPNDLEVEPTDDVVPHSSISTPDLIAANARRADARKTRDLAAQAAVKTK